MGGRQSGVARPANGDMTKERSIGVRVLLRTVLQPGDLGRLLHMHGVVYAQELGLDLTFEGYVASTLAHFSSPTDPARERLWLAEAADRLVGSIAIIKNTQEVAQLRWLLVDPAFRGMGVGATLVREAVTFARGAGYRSVFLETLKELPVAAALYRAAGFEQVQEEVRLLWGREVTDQRYEICLGDEASG
jgi:ribosomal protein S18 acetylase RimI-like enzyme